MKMILLAVTLLFSTIANAVPPEALVETRMCGVQRDAQGHTARSVAVINAFKRIHPCPSNGNTSGACPDWAIDHVIPLAMGGCDAVSNMQWLPNSIKRTSDKDNKDRWERVIYNSPAMTYSLK